MSFRMTGLLFALAVAAGLIARPLAAQSGYPCNEYCNFIDFGGRGHDLFSCTTEPEPRADSSTQGWACEARVSWCSVNVCNVSDVDLLSSDAGGEAGVATICRTAGSVGVVFPLDSREIELSDASGVLLWRYVSGSSTKDVRHIGG